MTDLATLNHHFENMPPVAAMQIRASASRAMCCP